MGALGFKRRRGVFSGGVCFQAAAKIIRIGYDAIS
jgi:hypothetical protein